MDPRSDASPPVPESLDAVDRRIAGFMRRWGIVALRISLGVIFIWFGMLKPLGLSPAAPLVRATVDWMPLLSPDTWVAVIGWWEVLIGVTFLFHRTARIAIALLAMTRSGVAAHVARNLRLIAHGTFARLAALEGPRFDPRADSAARLPYSSAIALGTAAWAAWRLWA